MSFLSLGLDQPVARLAETITGDPGSIGARFVMDGTLSGGRFSLVEHRIRPRGLAAPMHLHTREDEYSFVLEGRWGFQLADEVVYAEPGDLVYKPRDVWHTFWNASDEPARLLEVISPAGSSSSSSRWPGSPRPGGWATTRPSSSPSVSGTA